MLVYGYLLIFIHEYLIYLLYPNFYWVFIYMKGGRLMMKLSSGGWAPCGTGFAC